MGVFIEISVDNSYINAELARKLVALCPVDIYALNGEKIIAQPEQEDECTLCQLCLDAAPPGTISIRKTYNDETLVSRGNTLST